MSCLWQPVPKWEKPKTVKLYLHPPESRRFITIWPDFKVINAFSEQTDKNKKESYGIRVIFGKKAVAPEWEDSEFKVREDGIPVQTVITEYDNFTFTLQSFCDFGDIPVTYLKLNVKNKGKTGKKAVFGIMPRTGLDELLYGIGGDFYGSYVPLLEQWDMVANTWSLNDSGLKDNNKNIMFSSKKKFSFKWVERNKNNQFAKNYLEIESNIEVSGSSDFYFVMGENIKEDLFSCEDNYKTRLGETVTCWQAELNKIKNIPKLPDKNMKAVFYSLVVQCLQMFLRAVDGETRIRQGGRFHGVWPTESMELLRALDRMGLNDWSKKGYQLFLKYQTREGNDKGRFNCIAVHSNWANITGAVLYGLGFHLIKCNDKKYFAAYKNSILYALEWIEKERNKTKNSTYIKMGYGLFPPMRSHDWGAEGQGWSFTDSFTYMGVREMAEVFKYFQDPLADSIKNKADDYKNCLKKTLEKLYEPQKGKKAVFITNVLGKEETYPPIGPYFCDGPSSLFRAGIIEPKSEILKKVERYFIDKGWMKNGLTGLMTDCFWQGTNWAGHTWYTSYSDYSWFKIWLKGGERGKAKKTLMAQLKYGMTKEYYLMERYADNDPSFCPWQPNGSANGRTIMMFFDFYKEKKQEN